MPKIIVVVAAVVVVMTTLLYLALKKIDTLEADVTRLTLERNIALADKQGALEQIDHQNAILSAHAADMDAMKVVASKRIAELSAKSTQIKTQVIEKIVKNPSCENQLNIIKQHIGEWYENGKQDRNEN